MAIPVRLLLAAGLGALLGGCVHYTGRPIVPAQTAADFDRRSLADPGLADFLRANHLSPPGSGRGWNLDELTFAAFYYQPALAEARARLEAIRAAEKTARQRPNPTLTAAPAYDNGIPDNPTPWSLAPLSLDFPIETAGKRRDRMEEARAQSDAERWNLVAAIWQVRSDVRSALLGLYLARERRSLLADEAQAQERVVRLLQGQLNAGNVSGYDLTQARIGLATTRLALQDGLVQYENSLTQLAGAVGLPRSALEGVPLAPLGDQALPPLPRQASLRQDALLNRADVRAALAQYSAAQAALKLEVANQYPDLDLGPGYQYNSGSAGDNMWQLSLSLPLPIFNHNQGPLAEAEARRKEAGAHFLSVQAQAIGQIDGALAGYRVALEEAATAAGLASDLDRRRQSMRALAQAGEADPLDLANAEVEYDSAALARLASIQQAREALGQLEDAVQDPAALSPAAVRAAAAASLSTSP